MHTLIEILVVTEQHWLIIYMGNKYYNFSLFDGPLIVLLVHLNNTLLKLMIINTFILFRVALLRILL